MNLINPGDKLLEGRHDWVTALGYAKLHDLPTGRSYLSRVGRRAAAILRARGDQPHKRQDATFGAIYVFPASVLETAFEEDGGGAPTTTVARDADTPEPTGHQEWCKADCGQDPRSGPAEHHSELVALAVPHDMAKSGVRDILSVDLYRDDEASDPDTLVSVNSGGNGALMAPDEAEGLADTISVYADRMRELARRGQGVVPPRVERASVTWTLPIAGTGSAITTVQPGFAAHTNADGYLDGPCGLSPGRMQHLEDLEHWNSFSGVDIDVRGDGFDARPQAEEMFHGALQVRPFDPDPARNVPYVDLEVLPDRWSGPLGPDQVADVAAKLRRQADRLDQVHAGLVAAQAEWLQLPPTGA